MINLENDDAKSEDAFFLIDVIKRVGSPYLRALPDFGNSIVEKHGDTAFNYAAVKAMFAHAYNISHVKAAESSRPKLYHVDLAETFEIAKQAGFKGYYSMELDQEGDPLAGTNAWLSRASSTWRPDRRALVIQEQSGWGQIRSDGRSYPRDRGASYLLQRPLPASIDDDETHPPWSYSWQLCSPLAAERKPKSRPLPANRGEFVRFADPTTENAVVRLTAPSHASFLPAEQNRFVSSREAFLVFSSDRGGECAPFR